MADEQDAGWFASVWQWITGLWGQHDANLEQMVEAVLPMVIDIALRPDLSGEEKRKVIVDRIVDNVEAGGTAVAASLLNEAVEIAANKYNIQIGKITKDSLDASLAAALKAARDFANGHLNLSGDESENAGPTPGTGDGGS